MTLDKAIEQLYNSPNLVYLSENILEQAREVIKTVRVEIEEVFVNKDGQVSIRFINKAYIHLTGLIDVTAVNTCQEIYQAVHWIETVDAIEGTYGFRRAV